MKAKALALVMVVLTAQASAQVFPLPGSDINVVRELSVGNPEVRNAVNSVENIAGSYSGRRCAQAPSLVVYEGTFTNNAQAANLNAAILNATRVALSSSSKTKLLQWWIDGNQFATWTAVRLADGWEFSITYQMNGKTFFVRCSN